MEVSEKLPIMCLVMANRYETIWLMLPQIYNRRNEEDMSQITKKH
jgi:hypothetical protein